MVCRDLTKVPHTRLHNILQHPMAPASVSRWRVTQGDECLQLKSEKSLQSSVANMTELHCTSRSGLPQQINLSTKNPLYLTCTMLSCANTPVPRCSSPCCVYKMACSRRGLKCKFQPSIASKYTATGRSEQPVMTRLRSSPHLSSGGWQVAAGGDQEVSTHFLGLRDIGLLLTFLIEVSQLRRGCSATPSHD